jgi:DNA-binding NarL/FixJ family response regulator
VAADRKWLPRSRTNEASDRAGPRCEEIEPFDRLTKREREVMRQVSRGLSNKEVGRRLNITEGTVKQYLCSIYEKLGVNNRTALANIASVLSLTDDSHIGANLRVCADEEDRADFDQRS